MKQNIDLINQYFFKDAVEKFDIKAVKDLASKVDIRNANYCGDNILHIFFAVLAKKIVDITKNENLDEVTNYLKDGIKSDLEIGQYLIDFGALVNRRNKDKDFPLDILRGMASIRGADEYNKNLKLIYGKIINFVQKNGAIFTTIPACFIERNIDDNKGRFIVAENILQFSKISNLITTRINHARIDKNFIKEAPIDIFLPQIMMENFAQKGNLVFCPEIIGNILSEIRENNLDESKEISAEDGRLGIVEIIKQNLNCDDKNNKFIRKKNIVRNAISEPLLLQKEIKKELEIGNL